MAPGGQSRPMGDVETTGPGRSRPFALEPAAPASDFRLLRYFTITTLVAFVTVGAVLFALQRNEEAFFAQVQREQRDFFAQAQAKLARQQEEAALKSLLAVHEASHLNLTLLVGNLLWKSHFGPFVARAQALPVQRCRALPGAEEPAGGPRRECFAALGRSIQALPGFQALDHEAYAAMRGTSVFKIKVFDLRGLTIYSSEHAQIGEDGGPNEGWRSAAAGRAASELTHRQRFSAFERVVEDRDLISTYVPVRAGAQGEVLGVFELYSDVTPFLVQIKQAAQRFASVAAGNDAALDRRARDNQRKVSTSSDEFLLIVGCLLALLYWVSLLIVGNGQRLIDKQNRARIEAAQREQMRHREKMAALATMAASLSHEVGNPLAIIAGIAQELPEPADGSGVEPSARRRILVQTARVGAMIRQMSDFATTRSEQVEFVDVNTLLKAVCDFHAFDRRFRGVPISFEGGAALPACELVPDHLNETMMSLLQAWVDARVPPAPGGGLQVRTEAAGPGVLISVGPASGGAAAGLATALAADPRLDTVRRRVADMRGSLEIGDAGVRISLPPASDAA